MDAKNHHLHKPVFIGEIQADGQFNVVWKTDGPDQGPAVEPVHPERQGQEPTEPALSGRSVCGHARWRRSRDAARAARSRWHARLRTRPRPWRSLLRVALLGCVARAAVARARTPLAIAEADRIGRIAALVASRDPRCRRGVLEALADDELQVAGGKVAHRRRRHGDRRADRRRTVSHGRDAARTSIINNRVRRELGPALAALRLLVPDRDGAARRGAATSTADAADEAAPADPEGAGARRPTPRSRTRCAPRAGHDRPARATMRSAAPRRRSRTLRASASQPSSRLLAGERLDGRSPSPTPGAHGAQARSIDGASSAAWRWGERVGGVFSGLSLGSVLLLAALGLAITFGLMGVINMAHGELLMLGAYATYVVQNLFRSAPARRVRLVPASPPSRPLPRLRPLVGRGARAQVIRFLYGRPLETLLATWGISLVLIQTVRTIFGAQNVEVANPSWLSGGVELLPNLVLPYNRIAIIAFSLAGRSRWSGSC